ncbi:MAG: histidine kinase, partial [Gorillibacterium sp.]|nr:histidine kinase [Gorillibacterium sp.]
PYLVQDGQEGTVLSISRAVQLDNEQLSIYIETKIQDFFFNSNEMNGGSLLVVDHNGIITHSGSKSFEVGNLYATSDGFDDVYLFQEKSSQGWSLVSVIPKSYYNLEINEWLLRFFILGISSLCVSVLFAWVTWRTVNRPLRSLNKEIMYITKNQLLAQVRFTGVKEFDFLLMRFQDMRARIRDLLSEVRDKEKRKASLEVEKLMHQINPHFMHNTLDTIRWLARMEGHEEIDRLVSMLNKLLYYNIGKGKEATIEDEIGALGHYVSLQQVRYNFQFDVRIDTDPVARDALIPRFILQPLVENALYHGDMADDGIIRVVINREEDNRICICVTDNGAGMDQVSIDRMMKLNDESSSIEGSTHRTGMGIGINYVRRMIEFQFGKRAEFRIESEIGKGTTILMRIPYETKGRNSDEGPDCG